MTAQPAVVREFILGEVARLTKRESVDLTDDVAALGADSAALLALGGAIEERFDIGIDLVDIFHAEDLGELCTTVVDAILDVQRAELGSSLVPTTGHSSLPEEAR